MNAMTPLPAWIAGLLEFRFSFLGILETEMRATACAYVASASETVSHSIITARQIQFDMMKLQFAAV